MRGLLLFAVPVCKLSKEAVAFQIAQYALVDKIRGLFTAEFRHTRRKILQLALQSIFHRIGLERQSFDDVILVEGLKPARILFAQMLSKARQRDIFVRLAKPNRFTVRHHEATRPLPLVLEKIALCRKIAGAGSDPEILQIR